MAIATMTAVREFGGGGLKRGVESAGVEEDRKQSLLNSVESFFISQLIHSISSFGFPKIKMNSQNWDKKVGRP